MKRGSPEYRAYVKAKGDERSDFPADFLDGINRRVGRAVLASAQRITAEEKTAPDRARARTSRSLGTRADSREMRRQRATQRLLRLRSTKRMQVVKSKAGSPDEDTRGAA